MTQPSVLELIRLALDSVRETNAFKKVSQTKLSNFSLDILFVALGVRTGYLFDAFSWNEKSSRTSPDPLSTFENLLQQLRRRIPLFNDVVILRDELRTDFMFVKVPRLLERIEAGDLPIFVSLRDPSPTILPSPPSHVATHLDLLRSDLTRQQFEPDAYPLSVVIPWDSSDPAKAVPLAAILLEYPIAYVPSDGATGPFLSNVELEVFTGVLSRVDGAPASDIFNQEHSLLQFSCPKELGAVHDIGDELRLRFRHCIADLGLPYKFTVCIRTERLDRVAL